LSLSGMTPRRILAKRRSLAQLEHEMRRALPLKRLVFGEGDPDARLVIVGEAPGKEEEALGRPFVGRAGQLLDQLLAEHSLKRQELWITNVVKWRPTEGEGSRLRTRAPRLSEVRMSQGWLARELEIIGSSLVLCLGNVATRALIDSHFQVSADHGRWHTGVFGAAALATFHPAYVLRQGKRVGQVLALVRQDLRKVKARYEELGQSVNR